MGTNVGVFDGGAKIEAAQECSPSSEDTFDAADDSSGSAEAS